MKWEAINAVGEIAGATAVVITLIYLSFQLQQNTSALRSSTWQAIQDSELRFDIMLTENPQIIKLFLLGNEGCDNIEDPVERTRYGVLMKQIIDLFQTHHYQNELGIIEDDWWQTWAAQYREHLEWKGFREVLQARYSYLRPSFQRFVDDNPHGDE